MAWVRTGVHPGRVCGLAGPAPEQHRGDDLNVERQPFPLEVRVRDRRELPRPHQLDDVERVGVLDELEHLVDLGDHLNVKYPTSIGNGPAITEQADLGQRVAEICRVEVA
jgi:hypothetical protein